MKKLNWKLSESNFTLIDKIKISKFILTDNFWTLGKNVYSFEKLMCEYIGSKYSIFLSNGSTANTILAYYLKDNFYQNNKNIIIFPSTTWATSINPFLREGFIPKFIDISLSDLCMDLNKLEEYLIKNSDKVCCIFFTSLLGFVPDIERLLLIQKKYHIRIMMDNCENTFGSFNNKNISSYFTSTTSTYFGHQIQSVEGGFIFTNDEYEYERFLMYRNHGMTRNIPNKEKYLNLDVDSKFDFYLLGNNFRNTNIHALIGILDFKRKYKYIESRIEIYNYFKKSLEDILIFPNDSTELRINVPFSIPLIFKTENDKNIIKNICESLDIETRPIISGNLLRQTCYKQYDCYKNFTNSEFIHNNAFYIGLHSKVKKNHVDYLIKLIKNNHK